MSLRISLALLALLALAACGFHPLYAKRNADEGNSQLFAGVHVDSISGRLGQEFRANLEDALNPHGDVPDHPIYRLTATITTSEAAIGVARDATVSRYNEYIDSAYSLFRISDGKLVTSGNIRSVSSYNNLTNIYFSTYESQQDAIKKGMQELSVMYRQRLSAYLDSGAPLPKDPLASLTPPPPPPPNPQLLTPLVPAPDINSFPVTPP